MKQYRRQTPLGTKDLLLEESRVRRDVERTLTSLFESRGFSEVMTPGMEYFDVFSGEKPVVDPEQMYKMTDTKGRLLVMRPDSTLPIARLAATRLANAPLPLRLYYAQDVFRMNVGLTGRPDQEFQAGVELIGVSGMKADIEMIALAASALKKTALGGYRLEIGHIGFFESLMEELETDPDVQEEIRSRIEQKNYAALGDLLDRLPQTDAVAALRRLPRLFGSAEVLDAAGALCQSERGKEALHYLASLYQALSKLGLGEQVMIDLGMLHVNEYYTGVIFRGYIEGSGETVLSGGRYDALVREFGEDRAATGFAINVDAITNVLRQRGSARPQNPCAVLVHAQDGMEAQALAQVESLTEQGVSAEYSVFDSTDAARQYAQQRGIKELRIVGQTVTIENL
ncbi:MAG: ATP phosphoribosyltransferase regulatory subunit [Clostridia bacterium]|nr:ATP phosphoribosyltransferase regulatory subunit [Clostridia bacterium]